MKAFKAFIKPFEAPQRSVKIKIELNFFTLSGIGTLRVKIIEVILNLKAGPDVLRIDFTIEKKY